MRYEPHHHHLYFDPHVRFIAACRNAFGHCGRVTDSEGAAIAKARVLIHWDPSGSRVGVIDNVGSTQDVSVLTDSNGAYFASVPEGFYDVFVSAPTFTPMAAKIIAKQGQRATLKVKLRIDPLVAKELGAMEVYAAPKK